MTRLIFTILLLLLLTSVRAQSGGMETAPITNTPPDDSTKVFTEVLAEFPGGQQAMLSFIQKNVRYPKPDRKDKREGKVIASFEVTANGTIEDIQILKGVSPTIDAEVIRVIGLMPKWTPSSQNGKAVSSKFTLPFNFKLP